MSFIAPGIWRTLYGASALAFLMAGTHYASAETIKRGNKTYQVVGAVSADLDDKKQEWVVVDSHLVPGLGGSAYWELDTLEIPSKEEIMEQMREVLVRGDVSSEQKQQLEMAMQMMEQFGPMFEGMMEMGMLGDEDSQQLSIHISAFDPDQKEFLDEGVFRLNVELPTDAFDAGGEVTSSSVDLHYIVKGGNSLFLPELAYWSDETDAPAEVTFTSFTFNDDGTAHAQGHFSAKLCRWEKSKMMQGLDTSDCKTIRGGFDTQLVEFKDSPAS